MTEKKTHSQRNAEQAKSVGYKYQKKWNAEHIKHIGVNINMDTCADVLEKWKSLDNKAERFVEWVRSLE